MRGAIRRAGLASSVEPLLAVPQRVGAPRVARGRRALAAPQSRRQPRRRPRDSGRRHRQPSRPDPPLGGRRTRRWRVSSQGAGENINKWQRQSALHDLVPLVVDTHGRTGREFVRQVIVRGARSAGLGCAWGVPVVSGAGSGLLLPQTTQSVLQHRRAIAELRLRPAASSHAQREVQPGTRACCSLACRRAYSPTCAAAPDGRVCHGRL